MALSCLIAIACGAQPDSPSEMVTEGDSPAAVPPLSSLPLDSAFALAASTYLALEHQEAREIWLELRARARAAGDIAAEARAINGLGLVEWRLAVDYGEAERLLLESLELKQRHGISDRLFASYNNLGLVAWSRNRLSRAAEYFAEAIRLGAEGEEVGAVATARMNLALVQTEWGDFTGAMEGFLAMRDTMEAVGHRFHPQDRAFRRGTALTNLGMLEVRAGNPTVAVRWLTEAIDAYREGSPEAVGFAMGHLATAYTALGDHGAAFTILDASLEEARRQGLRQEEASNLEALAEQYRESGDFRRALDHYHAAMEINAEIGLTLETASDLRGEAEIHLVLGAPELALRAAEEALLLHRPIGATLDQLYDHLVLAEAFDALADVANAAEHVATARELAGRVGTPSARVAVALTAARIADRRADHEAVLDALDAVRADLESSGYAEQSQAQYLASRAQAKVGRADEALALARSAFRTVERVRQTYGSGTLGSRFSASRRAIYGHLVTLMVDGGRWAEAFDVADAARGWALVQGAGPGLRGEGASGSQGNELLLREIHGVLESIRLIEIGVNSAGPEDDASALEELYERLDALRTAFEDDVMLARQGSSARAAASLPPSQTVRAALGASEALLEYFVPEDGVVRVFVARSDTIVAIEARVDVANLASRVRVARDLISRPRAPDAANTVLEGLHDALIAPVVESGLLSDVDRIVFVPHDALAYLPFAALRDPTDGTFLGARYEVSVLPNAAVLAARRDVPAEGAGAATVFAPLPDELPGSLREAEAASAALGDARALIGGQATEQRLREALTGTATVHVATHGVMNAANPMFSRVLLAPGPSARSQDDGRLEVHELLELRANAHLVFLSGCETGLGRAGATRFSPGEDYTTLGQALLMAGARSVVATLWRVDDEASAVFARRFYESLRDRPAAAALAEVQAFMRSQPRYAAPYFWAGYQLLGAASSVTPSQGRAADSV